MKQTFDAANICMSNLNSKVNDDSTDNYLTATAGSDGGRGGDVGSHNTSENMNNTTTNTENYSNTGGESLPNIPYALRPSTRGVRLETDRLRSRFECLFDNSMFTG